MKKIEPNPVLWQMNGKRYKYEAVRLKTGDVLLTAKSKTNTEETGGEFPTIERAMAVARLMN